MDDDSQFKLTPVVPEPIEVEDEDDLEKGELRELTKPSSPQATGQRRQSSDSWIGATLT